EVEGAGDDELAVGGEPPHVGHVAAEDGLPLGGVAGDPARAAAQEGHVVGAHRKLLRGRRRRSGRRRCATGDENEEEEETAHRHTSMISFSFLAVMSSTCAVNLSVSSCTFFSPWRSSSSAMSPESVNSFSVSLASRRAVRSATLASSASFFTIL